MTTCRCPTCDQPLNFTGLYINKARTYAAYGDEIVKLAPTEGELLYVLRSGASLASLDIRTRTRRKPNQSMITGRCLSVWIHHLRQKIEPLGLSIYTTGDGFRLMFPRAT